MKLKRQGICRCFSLIHYQLSYRKPQINRWSLNWCLSHTEIFSKRRKIYAVWVKDLSCNLNQICAISKLKLMTMPSSKTFHLCYVIKLFLMKVIFCNRFKNWTCIMKQKLHICTSYAIYDKFSNLGHGSFKLKGSSICCWLT